MENIGIVRRVDDLGRVVIPKEMRNALRIKNGDCLEAFLENEKIILVKKDVMGDRFNIFNPVLNSLSNILNINILITDTDKVLSVYGKDLKDFLNKKIDNMIYNYIINRNKTIGNDKQLFLSNTNYIISPIIINGDAIGSIIFVRTDKKINSLDEFCMNFIENLFLCNLEV